MNQFLDALVRLVTDIGAEYAYERAVAITSGTWNPNHDSELSDTWRLLSKEEKVTMSHVMTVVSILDVVSLSTPALCEDTRLDTTRF